MKHLHALTLLAAAIPALAAPTSIFHSGKIITVDQEERIAQALAVEGNRIVAVGSDADVMKLADSATRLYDLKGKVMLPGLMDSHSHPVGAATFEFDHPIPDIADIPQLLDYITARTKAVPEGSLIFIRQVFITRLKEQRYPTRAELDAVAPKHPVHFSTGPDSMLNSLALELAGIGPDFKLPEGSSGRVERDTKGALTGMVRGFSPKIKAPSPTKTPTPEQTLNLVEKLFADCNRVGYTTLADRGSNPTNLGIYKQLKDSGNLSVRLRASHTFSIGNLWPAVEKAINDIANHPLCKGDDMLKIVGTKVWLDGGMLTGSALMQEPWGVSEMYGIIDPEYRGVQNIPREPLKRAVEKVSSLGLQFTAHAVGDGATQLLVDIYEELSPAIRPTRPCVTHCNFMAPDTIAKAAKLGVVIDLQPIWFHLDGRTLLKQFGMERMKRFQPLRAMVDAGIPVGGGSDHMQKIGSLRSINPYDPWLGMWIAVSRQCRFLDEPLHLDSGLTRMEALKMYTIDNAKVLFMEKDFGSLEAGKRADFIIIDRDILECPQDDIRETKVLSTWLDGKMVWGKE